MKHDRDYAKHVGSLDDLTYNMTYLYAMFSKKIFLQLRCISVLLLQSKMNNVINFPWLNNHYDYTIM